MKKNSDSVEKTVAIYSGVIVFFVFGMILAFSNNFQNRIDRLEQKNLDNNIMYANLLNEKYEILDYAENAYKRCNEMQSYSVQMSYGNRGLYFNCKNINDVFMYHKFYE